MNTLWLKDGEPFYYTGTESMTPSDAAEIKRRWEEELASPGRPIVLANTTIRNIGEPAPLDFGTQLLTSEFDPGWPTHLVVFASAAFGLIGFLAGVVFG